MKQESSYYFEEKDISDIRRLLLNWYTENKRDLPWRRAAENKDKQQHAYAVWVSEIMLQQTRVATVIDYYRKWMLKWPTVASLAKANLDEVNEVWAGLGYYSRARRLHEGAGKVINELGGKIPENSADLIKQIPGVGRYTAAAISSIAFNEAVGVLDGNVIRVLCRMLTIGGDVSSKKVLDHLWSQVDRLIPAENPGDFNQAIMELGALVCTPKSPQCANCPLQSTCGAYKQVENYRNSNSVLNLPKNRKRKGSGKENGGSSKKSKKGGGMKEKDLATDIESCDQFLSLPSGCPWAPEQGVMNYPRKAEKTPPRQETAFISVVEMGDPCSVTSKVLITQRPKTGLLAGLWEFPTVSLNEIVLKEDRFVKLFSLKNPTPSILTQKYISEKTDCVLSKILGNFITVSRSHIGEYTHVFSHIHLRYVVEHLLISPESLGQQNKESGPNWKWVRKDDLAGCAMSSAMHKIIKLCHNGKGKMKKESGNVKQKKMDAFFKPKPRPVKIDAKAESDVKVEIL